MDHLTMPASLTTSDGLTLALYRHTASEAPQSGTSRPTLVAVHGYPDNAGVWNALIPELVETVDVVTYDVRGTGSSDAPTSRTGYLLPALVADLNAVIAWAQDQSPAPVHLLAHDWGSIQAWQAVTEPGEAAHVASFTSISGPCLDHVERWIRSGLRRGSRRRMEVVRQLGHSMYIPFFKVRGLAEIAGRTGVLARLMSSATQTAHTAPNFVRHRRDIANGLELYRQNMLTRRNAEAIGAGNGPRLTDVPVQIVTPLADPYVGPGLGASARTVLPDVTVARLNASHWVIVTHPQDVAQLVKSFIEKQPQMQ